MDNKRQCLREPVRIEARYQDTGGHVLRGTVVNISRAGVYIQTSRPLNVSAPLSVGLDFIDLGKIVDVHGRVVRVDPGRGMAVEFTRKNDRALSSLIGMFQRVVSSSAGKGVDGGDLLRNYNVLTNSNIDQGEIVGKKENRQHSRRLLRIEVRYQNAGGTVLKGTVRNLSLGGVFVETGYPLEKDTSITLSLDAVDIGKVIDVQGMVVRVVPYKGMGIRFTGNNNRDIRLLIHAMRKLDQASMLSLSRSALGD